MQHRWGIERLWWRMDARAPVPDALARPATPEGFGDPKRGRDLLAGRHLRAGQQVQSRGRPIWSLGPETDPESAAQHRFGWLDDLAAQGGPAARDLAWDWLKDWITRYGDGRGPGWTFEATAKRLTVWVSNGAWLTQSPSPRSDEAAFLRSLSLQSRWLARHWHKAQAGPGRVMALSALLQAEMALYAAPRQPARRAAALGQAAATAIGQDGAIASRDPEALLDLLCSLNTAAAILGAATTSAQRDAMDAAARLLRALRHADGELARFHGGGRGAEGRLERALLEAEVPVGAPPVGLRMGYARLAAARTTVLLDAARPPSGPLATRAHASTLAFEMTCGRRPLIVSCGSGAHHGPDWRRAGRATPSHSTLCLDGHSSARLGMGLGGAEPLVEGPGEVLAHRADADGMQRIEASHDAWRANFGLTHDRRLGLDRGGLTLVGEDLLTTLGPADERAFDAASHAGRDPGVAFTIRFHLHPDVEAALDAQGAVALLRLRSGEVWRLAHDGGARLSLAPSVYLEKSRSRPVPTQQVVLSGRAMAYATLVRWSLVRSGDAVLAPRDLWRGEGDPA
ncbi:heparinase II/III family protein [uncultured Limimaricola sp.]|uniref:heparinase II/III family protein n=1 Tax=uncultured Limimaricola sp. TaxID=2211667 RepID=UPI0030F87D8B